MGQRFLPTHFSVSHSVLAINSIIGLGVLMGDCFSTDLTSFDFQMLRSMFQWTRNKNFQAEQANMAGKR